MYEIVDAYRLGNLLLTMVLVFVVSFLLSSAVVAKINGYDYGPHLPYYWVFIGALLLSLIGISYFVYYSPDKCYVGEIRNIKAVETYSETKKQSDTDVTRYYVRVYEKDNKSRTFMCFDDISAELIAREFSALGIGVSDKGSN